MVDETKSSTENEAVTANEAVEVDAKKTELNEAIALVNKGLEDLSPEELAKVYSILKSHSGEVNDAGSAFAKLDAFSEKKVQDFADKKENVAPEELSGVQTLAAEVVTVHSQNAEQLTKAVASRVAEERAKFDKGNSLESLTPESAPILEANLNAVDQILAANPPLAVKEDKTLVNPELQTFADFIAHIDLEQVSDSDGVKTKEELAQEALELAVLEAQTELALNPEFAKLSDEDKRKKTMQTIASHLDAMALQMLKAQMESDFQTENADLLARRNQLSPEEQKQLDEKVKDFEARFKQAAQGYLNRKYPEQNFKLSNAVGSAVIITGSRNLVGTTTRIEEKTGFAKLKERALKFDSMMKSRHPKMYSAVKKGMTSAVVGYASGGVGLAVLAGVRSYKLVRTSYKTYKESGFEGSYMGYLKANPKEMTSLITSVAMTGVTAAFAGADVYMHGLSSATGLGGQLLGENAAKHATNKLMKASIRGGISLTSGLSASIIDWRAARLETDPEKRKKLYRNAVKTVLYSTAGAAIGLISAEYSDKAVSWLKERFGSHEDLSVGTPVKTGAAGVGNFTNLDSQQLSDKLRELGVNPDRFENMNPAQKLMLLNRRIQELGPLAKEAESLTSADLTKLSDKELSAELEKLGVNPERFENMNQAQKMMLLNKRVNELGDLAKEDTAAVSTEGGNVTEAQLKHMMKLNSDRHPGVDMDKIYSQLKAAGIKNPQEAFYKLEQSRLLAPNDKIMTVDGTNIRDTMTRALKGEKLTAADLQIVGRSIENVDNTGHYLNDVRAQGGTGYSYRPGGKPIVNENTGETKTGAHGGAHTEDSGTRFSGTPVLDVEKMSDEDKILYLNMMKSFQDKGAENWQLEANKEYLHYRQLLTDGKEAEAEALAKSFKTSAEADVEQHQQPTAKEDENNPYRINSEDSKRLISAKREALKAEAAYKASIAKVKLTEAEVKAVQDLPVDDPKRIAAEYKYGLAMKDEVKKQFALSKKELGVAKAQRDQIADTIEDRKKMEARVGEIGKELKRYGIDKTNAPQMTGEYGEDKRSVRQYFRDVLRNKRHSGPSMKLLKEREELMEKMRAQGPRQVMEQQYADAESKVDSLSKRKLYRENEAKEKEQYQAQSSRNSMNEVEDRIEGAADKYATTSLAAAEKLKAGEMFGLKDKVGNNQFVGVDKEGHAFKITEVRHGGKGVQLDGDIYKIEVGKDHPMYAALHDENPVQRGLAKEAFYKKFQKSVLGNEFNKVEPVSVRSVANSENSVQNIAAGGRN